MSVEAIVNQQNLSSDKTQVFKGDTLGRDQFLTLLIAQLKNQDPLNPMESTDFTAQLAQYSSLEQLFKVNTNLEGIHTSVDNQTKGNPIDYIGKIIKADDNTIAVKDDEALTSSFVLNEKADVTVVIYDSEGREVRTYYKGWMEAGEHNVEWDARSNSGTQVPDGNYQYDIFAQSSSGEFIEVGTFSEGEVTGVTNQYDIPYLLLGNKQIAASSVIEIKQKEE